VEQAIHQRSAGDLDMVGELEAALERARGDPLVEDLTFRLVGLVLLLAADRQRVFFALERQLILGKARDCN
jgi:hypothetical protein